MAKLDDWARQLKRSIAVLMLAMKHPRTPWYAKGVGALTLLYALAPIDLIPDFLPVVGQLDDLILVPIGIWLTIRLVPGAVWTECRAEAERRELQKPPKDWRGMILIIFLWLVLLAGGIWAASRMMQSSQS
jgi:uncharacterized membrane protein YkvA (DUF1232 family)